MAATVASGGNPNGAALFEAANKLRGSVESAQYKHLVLGLLFLKYISDSSDLRREELEAELADRDSENYVEDPDCARRRHHEPTSDARPLRTRRSGFSAGIVPEQRFSCACGRRGAVQAACQPPTGRSALETRAALSAGGR